MRSARAIPGPRIALEDGSRGSHAGRDSARLAMLLLLAVTGLVLLIAA
jgi:hypothetical protein